MSSFPSPRSVALRAVIETFLSERLEAKLKPLADDDPQRHKLKAQFRREAWVADAARRAGQIQMVTHVLKAGHPAAQGSSLYAQPESLPDHGLVSSQCLGGAFDADVVGNAAALDIVQFLRLAFEGRSLLALMAEGDTDLAAAMAGDPALARPWMEAFVSIRQADATTTSHTLAKQVYWLVGDDALKDDGYHLLAPLYASSLAQRVHERITADRFSEAAKATRQARWNETFSEAETHDYPNLAVQKLGGTKPQNISKLNSERRGVNYLLASLPPLWTRRDVRWHLRTDSVLRGFARKAGVRATLTTLQRFLQSDPPANLATRQRVNQLAGQVVDEFVELESQAWVLEPGWSADAACQLNLTERFWLDGRRALTDDAFRLQREQSPWPAELAHRFASWFNAALDPLHRSALMFDDGSFGHWQQLLLQELQARQREGLIDA
jgi:CRISPR-associated protein Csy1